MLKRNNFYIDLGTANTLIFSDRRGFLLNQPSVCAVKVRERGEELFALGESAKLMEGKTPDNLLVSRPLRAGVIADFDSTARMIHGFLRRVQQTMSWIRPRILISLPCRVTPFERKAVEEIGIAMGASTVHLLDEPVAAAIGAGLPVLGHRANMIVDIGGGTTEIAVLALGGIIAADAVRVGGDSIDDAIVERLRLHFNFRVGPQTAERIKLTVATLDLQESLSIEAGGIDMHTGLPQRKKITSDMIYPAVDGVVKAIIASVQTTLEKCPPEVCSDIAESGIVLAGGGAMLRGLQDRLQREVGVVVRISDQPLFSVAMGGAKVLQDAKLFDVIGQNQAY